MQRVWTAEDLKLVEGRLGLLVPQDTATVLLTAPLVGMRLSLDDDADPSGMGVDMQWMSAEQAVEEATKYYPGILAFKAGYPRDHVVPTGAEGPGRAVVALKVAISRGGSVRERATTGRGGQERPVGRTG